MNRPAVLGAGSWGTALSIVLARRGLPVKLWVHDSNLAATMSAMRVNASYLPSFPLPENIEICTALSSCLQDADAVVIAVPSHHLRSVMKEAKHAIAPDAAVISATKGLEAQSLLRMSQVLREVLAHDRVAVLSGPSFARDVAAAQPTALVAASFDASLAWQVQTLFSGPRFRVYASQDVTGVEIGGAVKNVIAIAAGVCHGLDLGQNSIAALITRGLAELSRLAVSLGALPETLAGLAGLGDLVLTCTGELSRNRQVGIELAHGRTLAEILQSTKTVAEGIKTTDSVLQLGAQNSVSLPISEQMHAVLHGRTKPHQAISVLMERSLRDEW